MTNRYYQETKVGNYTVYVVNDYNKMKTYFTYYETTKDGLVFSHELVLDENTGKFSEVERKVK